ncbi:MAG: hypothetical protein ACYC27_23180 [Armatimonadota bacterium]
MNNRCMMTLPCTGIINNLWSMILVFLIPLYLGLSTSVSAQPVIFPDSRVTGITPWSVCETADYLPEEIFPAYIGSGRIGIGLDASGMQNLDCKIGMQKRYTGAQFEAKDELYVHAEGMISSHYIPNNLMPLGYLNYSISVDGSPVSLKESTIGWQRTIDVRKAVVTTEIVLNQGIRLIITAFSPYDTYQAYYRFQIQSTDGKDHNTVIRPQLSLELRQRDRGGAILDRVTKHSINGNTATLTGSVDKDGKHSPLEDYKLAYNVTGQKVWVTDNAIGAELTLESGGKPASKNVVFSIGKTDPAGSYNRTLRSHQTDWAKFYDSGANISVGDTEREFLFNNSLYLFRICGTYNNGVPLQYLLFHPENWYTCTFWDLSFITDALIKSNNLEPVRRTVSWLDKIAAPTGPTFRWMTLYNGDSGMPKTSIESSFVANASHAMSAIRYYEATGDKAFLKSTVYPILRKTSTYLAKERFIKEGDHYIGTGSGIDANTSIQVNDTYTTVWFGVVLKKTAEYAKILGIDVAERAGWEEIADNIQLSTCERGYKFSRNWPGPDGWVWMLLYPTEGMPLLNMEVFAKNREHLYYGNLGQPWCYFWQASSDYRAGLNLADSSERYIAEGIKFTRGPGYFMEGVDPGKMEGLPPYTSAHASYITAITEQLVFSSVWDDEISVFTNLPASMLDRRVSFNRIRTSRGVLVSGDYSPEQVCVNLSGTGNATVRIRVPKGMTSGSVKVQVDGVVRKCEITDSAVTLPVSLVHGKSVVVVVER